MKRVSMILGAALLCTCLAFTAAPVTAQQADDPVTDRADNDDETDWGWVGLIGLAGLLGLRKRGPDYGPGRGTTTSGVNR